MGVRAGNGHPNGGSIFPHDAPTSAGGHSNGYMSYTREFSSHFEQQTTFETRQQLHHFNNSIPAFVPPFFAKELLDSDVRILIFHLAIFVFLTNIPRLQESQQISQNSSEILANFAFLTKIFLQVCDGTEIIGKRIARLVHSTTVLARLLQKFCKTCVPHTKVRS